MATSRFNWATLLGIDEELKKRLGEGFGAINRNNNWGNQKYPMRGYMNNSDQDSSELDRTNAYDEEYLDEDDNSKQNSTQHSRQYSLEEEIDKKRNTFCRPNKHQLREAILWAEVIGEPKCKKRHRK